MRTRVSQKGRRPGQMERSEAGLEGRVMAQALLSRVGGGEEFGASSRARGRCRAQLWRQWMR